MIDGQALLLLTQTDIVKILCIKLGPAVKIYNSILMFKNTEESTDWAPPLDPKDYGFTMLSNPLDPITRL